MKLTIRGHVYEGTPEELIQLANGFGIAPERLHPLGTAASAVTGTGPGEIQKLQAYVKSLFKEIPLAKSIEYLKEHPKATFQDFARDHLDITQIPKSTGATIKVYTSIYNRFKRARSKAVDRSARSTSESLGNSDTGANDHVTPTLADATQFVKTEIDLGHAIGVRDMARRFYGNDFKLDRTGESRKKYRAAMDRFNSAKDRVISERGGSWETFGSRRRGRGVKWVFKPSSKGGD